MQTTIISPTDKSHWLELRSKNINSTDISSLFGVNPYQTDFELWHKLKNPKAHEIAESERMKWGNILEPVIANQAAQRLSLIAEPFKDYVYIADYKIGSSFDFKTSDNSLLEIKNVDARVFADQWIEDEDDLQAPPHIELQVQHQMLVSGIKRAYIAALVGGNTLKLITRDANTGIQRAILQKAAAFWASIEANNPPKINYEKDADFVMSLYDHAEPNKVIKPTALIDKLVSEYNELNAQVKALDTKKDEIKARLLEQIQDAEKVAGDTYTISAGITPEAKVSYTRKAFRNFRITNKRGKET